MDAPFVLAHPLTDAAALPLAPVAVAGLAVAAVLLTAIRPLRASSDGEHDPHPVPQPNGWAQAAMIAVLVVAVMAGRTGANQVTGNIAPALIVGAGWPLLVGSSTLLGPLWHRMNPWDGLARLFTPLTHDDADHDAAADVWPAVVTAELLVWYLFAYREALLPRSLGAAVALYTIATVAGCLALSRAAWLSRVEIVSIFAHWVGRIRRDGLVVWDVPRGAAPVLGVLIGGFLFGLVRYSRMLNPLTFNLPTLPPETVGVFLASLTVAALLGLARRREPSTSASGTSVAAAVPVAAGLALAASLVRGQVLIAVQLLPILASDPLGRGWDLFGTASWTPNPNPLGDTWHVVLQVALIAAGGIAGAQVARQRAANASRRGFWPATTAVAVLVAAGVLAVTAV